MFNAKKAPRSIRTSELTFYSLGEIFTSWLWSGFLQKVASFKDEQRLSKVIKTSHAVQILKKKKDKKQTKNLSI